MVGEEKGGFAGAIDALLRRGFAWLIPLAVLALALIVMATEFANIPLAIRSFFIFLIERVIYGVPPQALPRPEMARPAELLFLVVSGVFVVVMFARRSIFGAATATAAALAAFSLFAWGMALRWGALFDVFTIAVALASVFFAGVAADATIADGAKVRARALLRQLPRATIAALTAHPSGLALGPERRNITYLSCRIRDYSARADSADPEQFMGLTRRLLTAAEGVLRDERGVIDRVTPGGVSCIFSAPIADEQAEHCACAAALRLGEAAERLNREQGGKDGERASITIGINSGAALVGDFGSEAEPHYGAAGRMVDTALELERIAAQYGVLAAIGEATRTRVERHFAFLELDLLPRAGGAPVMIYSLAGTQAVRASPKFRALQSFHQRIFEAYRARDWARARTLITQCRALSGANERLYDFYLDRIAYYERHPPGDSWDGTFRRASA